MQVWKAEFPARVLPREMQITDFCFGITGVDLALLKI